MTVTLRITHFAVYGPAAWNSTSSHSRPVFITILFLQPFQDWIIVYNGLWR